MILSPTGRIRADVHVGAAGDTFLLLQDPVQRAGPLILAPYVLSSDVALEDRTGLVEVVAVLGGSAAEDGADTLRLEALGPRIRGGPSSSGRASPPQAPQRFIDAGLVEVEPADVETWRIRRGIARTGVDLGPDALPAEAGLEDTIDFTKGCFLGQESVAKVANLGHPPRLVVAVRATTRVAPGATVLADGEPVGSMRRRRRRRDGRYRSGPLGGSASSSRWRARARSPRFSE